MERAITAIWDHLVTDRGVDPATIILHGRSLGSAPSIWLAGSVACGKVIIESGFTAALPVGLRLDLLWWDPLPNGERLVHVDEPVAILHSRNDGLILPWHADANAAAAESRGVTMVHWLDEPGHNTTVVHDPAAYFDALDAFARFFAAAARDEKTEKTDRADRNE